MGKINSKDSNDQCSGLDLCGGNDYHPVRKDRNEILFVKTYGYPKGTFTQESTKFLNENEILLLYFSQISNIAAIRYIILNGAHINTLDQDRTSPLHIACKSASLQCVEEIIAHGAMINIPDMVGWTPIHIACYYKRKDVIMILLKHGANLFFKDREGLFPFDLVQNDQGCIDAIEMWISHQKQIENSQKSLNEKEFAEDDAYFDHKNNEIEENHIKNDLIFKKFMQKQNNGDIKNISFNEKNMNDFIKFSRSNDKIIENYKYIPKKPKFTINYSQTYGTQSDYQISDKKIPSSQTVNPIKLKYNKFLGSNKNPQINHFLKYAYGLDSDLKKPKFVSSSNEFCFSNNKENNIVKSCSISVPKVFPEVKKFTTKNVDRDFSNNPLSFSCQIPKNNKNLCESYSKLKLEKEDYMTQNFQIKNIFETESSEDSFLVDFEESLSEVNFNLNAKQNKQKLRNKSWVINTNKEVSNFKDDAIILTQNKDNLTIDYILSGVNQPNNDSVQKENEDTLMNQDIDIQVFQDILSNDFLTTKSFFSDIIFEEFKLKKNNFYMFISKIMEYDKDFSLRMLLSFADINNNYLKLLNFIRTNEISKDLICKLVFDEIYAEEGILKDFMHVYLRSFEYSKFNICENMQKVLKTMSFSRNYKKIDQFAKIFSQKYFSLLSKSNSPEKKIFKSENSVYMFVFVSLILDIDIKQKRNLIFVDFMILLKYLNEGESFDSKFLKESYKFIKVFGLFSKQENSSKIQELKKLKILSQRSKLKEYWYIYENGWIVLLSEPNEIKKIVFLNNLNLYNFRYKLDNPVLTVNSIGGKNNIVIFNKKNKAIITKSVNSLQIQFETNDDLNEVISHYYNNPTL